MKISELIQKLDEIMGQEGDIDVMCWPYDGQDRLYDLTEVELRVERPDGIVALGAFGPDDRRPPVRGAGRMSLGDILRKLAEANRCNSYPDPLGLRPWTASPMVKLGIVPRDQFNPKEKPCTEENS